MERLPEHSIDLIDELNTIYPARPPALADSDREIWFKAGQRAVVEFLLTKKNEKLKRRRVLPSEDPEEDDDV